MPTRIINYTNEALTHSSYITPTLNVALGMVMELQVVDCAYATHCTQGWTRLVSSQNNALTSEHSCESAVNTVRYSTRVQCVLTVDKNSMSFLGTDWHH